MFERRVGAARRQRWNESRTLGSRHGRRCACLVRCRAFESSAQAARGGAPHIGEGGLPQFAEERGWLKLPAKWRLGNTSAVSVDAEGHVWVLHRPRTLPADLRAMAAPPVLEFDQSGNPVLEFDSAGNFLQGWGGSGRRL